MNTPKLWQICGMKVKKAGSVQMCIYDNALIMYGENNRKDKLDIYSSEALSVEGHLTIRNLIVRCPF